MISNAVAIKRCSDTSITGRLISTFEASLLTLSTSCSRDSGWAN